MGKGSKRRPMQISRKEYDLRWDWSVGLLPDMSEDDLKKEIERIRNEEKRKRGK